MRWTHFALTSSLLLCTACSPTPAKIEVKEGLLIGSKDETVQIQPTVKDAKGNVLSDVKVSYKSLTPTMATVDQSGTVRPVSSGMATILVKAGDASTNVEVLVQIPTKIKIKPQALDQFSNPVMMLGVTRKYVATVFNDKNEPMIAGEVRWSSSNPEVLTIDKVGNVKSLKEGESTLTAVAAGLKGELTVQVKHEELSEDGLLSQ